MKRYNTPVLITGKDSEKDNFNNIKGTIFLQKILIYFI